jgi:hypothetical protein
MDSQQSDKNRVMRLKITGVIIGIIIVIPILAWKWGLI